MNNVLGKLGGRKFLMALFGAIAIALHSWLGINPETVLTLGGVVAAYVLGQGLADGMSKGATSTVALLAKYDANKNGVLDDDEKAAALAAGEKL